MIRTQRSMISLQSVIPFGVEASHRHDAQVSHKCSSIAGFEASLPARLDPDQVLWRTARRHYPTVRHGSGQLPKKA